MSEPDHTSPAGTAPGGAAADPAKRPGSLGTYPRPGSGPITEIEVIAGALTALWLIGTAVYFLFLAPERPEGDPESGLRGLLTALVVIMPVAMIWVAATAARAGRVMREESQRLQGAIDAIRHAYIAQQQGNKKAPEVDIARKLDALTASLRAAGIGPVAEEPAARAEPARPAAPARASAPAPAQAPAEDQPTLALGTQVSDSTPPLSAEDFIRALNFPETAEDREGFAALRRALKDRTASQLVQAAQDVLTLLSQEGIYMDDLRPDRAKPEVWRQFASGARGRTIASLGGIRDRSSLALANARMRQDPIFRDAAHHFLRRFDRTFAEFEKEATDAEISLLADTRTARAFMLLGRCAGTFD